MGSQTGESRTVAEAKTVRNAIGIRESVDQVEEET